jgi:cellulose synthase/poly-beta-1,6-N-acetylglucosamine synthase-like glycosyltransferase
MISPGRQAIEAPYRGTLTPTMTETLSAPDRETDAGPRPELSVVVTLFEERATLEELHVRLTAALESLDRPYEVIYVDDGSTDGSFGVLEAIHDADPRVRAVRLVQPLDLGERAVRRAVVDEDQLELAPGERSNRTAAQLRERPGLVEDRDDDRELRLR